MGTAITPTRHFLRYLPEPNTRVIGQLKLVVEHLIICKQHLSSMFLYELSDHSVKLDRSQCLANEVIRPRIGPSGVLCGCFVNVRVI